MNPVVIAVALPALAAALGTGITMRRFGERRWWLTSFAAFLLVATAVVVAALGPVQGWAPAYSVPAITFGIGLILALISGRRPTFTGIALAAAVAALVALVPPVFPLAVVVAAIVPLAFSVVTDDEVADPRR